jgi:outer membrane autotransporter protein
MLALAALAAWPSLPPSARAADILWATGSTGDWNNPDNWQGSTLPGVDDRAIIDSGAATIPAAQTVTTATAVIGATAGSDATVDLRGLWQNTADTYIGNAGLGTLNIHAGGTLQLGSAKFLWVGYSGTGVLSIDQGAALRRSGNTDIYIGGTHNANTIGTAAPVGSGSVIVNGLLDTPGSYLRIGAGGDGYLYVGQTGTVNATGMRLTYQSFNTTGTAIIDGLWNSTGYIIASHWGSSYFKIGQTGTALIGDYFSIGQGDGTGNPLTATSTATIEGYMRTTGAIQIANRMNATVDITGTVIAGTRVYVGNGAQTNQTVTGTLNVAGVLNVNGANSTTESTQFDIGRYGIGYVNVLGTGIVTSTPRIMIARYADSYGELNIAPGGYWNGAGQLYIGYRGSGSIHVADGGSLFAASGVYLADQGGTASVTVDGYWQNNSGLIYTGIRGRGVFTINQTGTVKGANSFRVAGTGDGNTDTGDSNVYVHGVLDNGIYTIGVGYAGQGRMDVYSTGTVFGGDMYVGDRIAATGTLTLHPGAILLTNGDIFRIGNSGKGVLIVEEGAAILPDTNRISSANGTSYDFTLGSVANSSGTLHLSGTLLTGHAIRNGVLGTGYLDIRATSDFTAGRGYSQNANSTLRVELSSTRPPDALVPGLLSPVLSVGGGAALSGTLLVHGPDIATTIPDFQWDANGEARASSLTGVPVLRAAGGITGNFNTIEIDGLTIPSTLPDFIRGGGLKVNEGGPLPTRYDIGYGLAWNSGVDAAHGTFTVEAGKTFNVDVQLADRPGLVFDSSWDGQSLVKKGPGTLVLSVENAYTGLTTIEEGTLKFAGPAEITLGDLVNKGVIDFGSTDATATGDTGARYRTLRAASLSGTGAFRMGVNLDTGVGDRLVIRGDATGAYRLLITATGSVPTGVEPKSELVTIGGVNDISFTGEGTAPGSTLIIDGAFDSGPFNYEVKMEGNRIVILKTGLDPAVFAPIRGVPGAQSALWFDQQDNLSRRLGELRAPRENGSGFDLWARAHAASASIGGGSTDTRLSDVDFWGAELGADYTWMLDGDRVTLGLFAGTGNASQDFRSSPYSTATGTAYNTATGESDLTGAGLYAAWLGDTGWFANATLAAARYKNSFTAIDGSFNHTTGDYDETGIGATVEAGRRIPLAFLGDGWFVEPALQGALTRLTRGNYLTKGTSPLSVQGSAVSISRARATLRAGRAWEINSLGWLELTARASALRERSSGGEINIGPEKWRPNLDGNRYEAGLGLCWRPFDSGQIYFDYEYAAGDNYEKPWSLSLGFRLSL